MTLDTRMHIHNEVDVHELFAEFRRILGATDVHPYEDRDVSKYYGDGVWEIGNKLGIGLPALAGIKYRRDEPLRADPDACTDYCYPEDDHHHHPPAMWCEVSMDTAYGYKDAQGRHCGDLHACFVAELGQWLDERGIGWSWVNEYNSEVHGGDDRYRRLTDLMRSGDDAARWFNDTVRPAIFGANA